MTAQERAEKILSKLTLYKCTSADPHADMLDLIAASLEAYAEDVKTAKLEWAATESDRAFAEGRRAGLEEAVKITDDSWCDCSDYIRALISEGGKK